MFSFLFSFWLTVVCANGVAAQEKTIQTGLPLPTPVVKTSSDDPASTSPYIQTKATKTVIDESIPDDPALDRLVAPYSARVRELDVVIGKLEGGLRKGGLGAGSLGNFVTDGMRAAAGSKLGQRVDVAITNSGGLRKNAFSSGV